MGREAAALGLDTSRAAPRAGAGLGTGPLVEPKIPESPGLDDLRGHGVPLRPLGPRLRPARQARRRHRHGRVGDPVRARDRARRRAAARLPAHAAVGHAAQRARDLACRADGSSGASRRSRARCAAASTRARELTGARVRQAPAAMKLPERSRAGTCAGGLRSRAAREGRRRTTPSAASASCRRTRGIRRWRGRTSSSSPGARGGAPAPVVARPGGRARGRRDHLRHRLPGRPTCRSRGRSAAGRRTLAEAWDGSPQRAPRRTVAGLPEPVHAARAEHRPRPQLDGLHDRVAGRLRRSTRSARSDAVRGAVEVRPEVAGRVQRRARRRMQGTVWNTAAARRWYLDAHGPQSRPCGRTGPGASAGGPDPALQRSTAGACGWRHERQ